MKKLHMMVLIASLLATGFSGTLLADASIPLTGTGTIAALQLQQIPLDTLHQGVYYNISCQIYNAEINAVQMQFAVTGSETTSPVRFELNGKSINRFHQGSLQSNENQLKISGLVIPTAETPPAPGSVALTFLNLDQNHVVTTHDCVAIPAIGLSHTKQ